MRWEALTSTDFPEAVRKSGGVCILPMGVLERHGNHLPLGTDYLNAHHVATLAADKEPAVVFPAFYFGQIFEARCFPGTVALPPVLMLELLDAVLDEIGRNGFKKIILYSAHDGNPNLLGYLVNMQLWKEKPYVVYVSRTRITNERREAVKPHFATGGGHAGEWETSMVMAHHEEWVKLESVPDKWVDPLKRKTTPDGISTATDWYANYPDHYCGDAKPATAEKGRIYVQAWVDTLAEYIAGVKTDKAAPALQDEFFKRADQVGK
jgi:creatinine amidohydrolase